MPKPGRPAVAALFCAGDPLDWVGAVESLRRAAPDLPVVAGGPDPSALDPLVAAGASVVGARSLFDLVNQVATTGRSHVVAVTGPCLVPDHGLDPALDLLEAQLRVATVSFLADDAGFLTFLSRDLDETTVTGRLRDRGPVLEPAPIPFATGPVVVLSRYALAAVGQLTDEAPSAALAIADFSLRARGRGFLDVVDPSTFVARARGAKLVAGADEPQWLADRHPFVSGLIEREVDDRHGPLAIVHHTVRAKVHGLRILVDASWLGPWEMGTQVQTVAIVAALARRDDVERVTMAVGGAELSPSAGHLLLDPKVDVRLATAGNLAGLGPADVAHRPFQPDWPLDIDTWRQEATRTVVTLLDLISFSVGAYYPSTDAWLDHRRTVRQAVAIVDGVTVISEDVARAARMERLPVEPDRLFVVGLGTDHLRGDEPEAMPTALAAEGTRGPVEGRFIVVLGADYGHKNRDLAVKAHAELRRRGLDVGLVLAGASVAYGSSRALEEAAGTGGDRVAVLADVSGAERNWLLRHADLVLYPTSAEGFGLVPHEAARFGTPTVMVPVGPLAAMAEGLPVVAAGWGPDDLADAAEQLLRDPATAEAQVRALLDFGRELTWDATAARLVDVYRNLLARPEHGLPGPTRAGDELVEARRRLEAQQAEHDQLRSTHDRMKGSAAFRLSERIWAVRNAVRLRRG